jgi:hypothetical protein
MSLSIHSALNTVKEISLSDSALSTILDFERVIDELGVYVFRNWKLGELVEGPEYEKYFVTCTFMYPYKKMPDPRGGEQLLNYNCEVLYKRDELEYPVKIKNPGDYKPGTKLAKTKKVPIWLITITIPKKLMSDIEQGSIDLENEKIDMADLEQSYEEGLDEKTSKEQGSQQEQPQQQPEAGMGTGMGGMNGF